MPAIAASFVADKRNDTGASCDNACTARRRKINTAMHALPMQQRVHAYTKGRAHPSPDDRQRDRLRSEWRAIKRVIRSARMTRRLEPKHSQSTSGNTEIQRGQTRRTRRVIECDPVPVAMPSTGVQINPTGKHLTELGPHSCRQVNPVQRPR
jgi:hypothetical protein